MKYIDANKLIAAIEKRLKNIRDYINGTGMKYKGPKFYKARGKESAYDELLSIIYFLQQEHPEVDLEKEIKRWKDKHGVVGMDDLWIKFAHHFYELSRKASKDALLEWAKAVKADPMIPMNIDKVIEKIESL